MDELHNIISEIILHKKQVNISVKPWQISNLNNVRILDLLYNGGDAIYTFIIEVKKKFVSFTNIHREARRGTGTKSLMELEVSLGKLSKILNKTIQIIFPQNDQEDTKAWLEKNKYISIKDEDNILFVKEIRG